MGENLSFESQQQPNKNVTPDMLFLNKLAELRVEQENIEKQLASADEIQRKFLEIRREEIIKQIANYHQSSRRYQKTEKFNTLKEMAGEKNVAEIINFKTREQQPETEAAGIGPKFLEEFKKIKKDKEAGEKNN